MERVLCLVMGYVFGLFQTGYLYSRSKHMDIRNYGSGNSGSTNVLRVMGKKAGLIVFLGDAGKMIAACLITRVLFRSQPELLYVYLLYTGFGVILGHNFPFYMGFKGGKGIAVMAGLVAANSFWSLPESLLLIPVTLACFLIPVVITRYISVGSLAAYTVFLIEMILAGRLGWFDMDAARIYELDIILFALTVLAWYRHRENIKRLMAGTENKFGAKKKE